MFGVISDILGKPLQVQAEPFIQKIQYVYSERIWVKRDPVKKKVCGVLKIFLPPRASRDLKGTVDAYQNRDLSLNGRRIHFL